jgi:membrane-bound metal-dependent hydrolase YbcI (DUF457 family)
MTLLGGIIWVLAATGVAMLPMRYQFAPGFMLLLLAPVLIYQLGHDFGWIAAVAALAAFVSMFRKPLAYYARKFTGRIPPTGPS